MTWATFVVAALGTALLRTIPALRAPEPAPHRMLGRLGSLGAAAAAGLLATALLGVDGGVSATPLIAVAVTALVMRRTANLTLAFVIGLVTAALLP